MITHARLLENYVTFAFVLSCFNESNIKFLFYNICKILKLFSPIYSRLSLTINFDTSSPLIWRKKIVFARSLSTLSLKFPFRPQIIHANIHYSIAEKSVCCHIYRNSARSSLGWPGGEDPETRCV